MKNPRYFIESCKMQRDLRIVLDIAKNAPEQKKALMKQSLWIMHGDKIRADLDRKQNGIIYTSNKGPK